MTDIKTQTNRVDDRTNVTQVSNGLIPNLFTSSSSASIQAFNKHRLALPNSSLIPTTSTAASNAAAAAIYDLAYRSLFHSAFHHRMPFVPPQPTTQSHTLTIENDFLHQKVLNDLKNGNKKCSTSTTNNSYESVSPSLNDEDDVDDDLQTQNQSSSITQNEQQQTQSHEPIRSSSVCSSVSSTSSSASVGTRTTEASSVTKTPEKLRKKLVNEISHIFQEDNEISENLRRDLISGINDTIDSILRKHYNQQLNVKKRSMDDNELKLQEQKRARIEPNSLTAFRPVISNTNARLALNRPFGTIPQPINFYAAAALSHYHSQQNTHQQNHRLFAPYSMIDSHQHHQNQLHLPSTNNLIPESHSLFYTPSKRRRTKVTDTRLSPRTSTKCTLEAKNDESPLSQSECLDQDDTKNDDEQSISSELHNQQHNELTSQDHTSSDFYQCYNQHQMITKLMFFYTRYPSSTILRNFFPDVKFNKANTAQLVKWFSNFREFFYIQIEKYARQYLNEGLRNCDEFNVTIDSEIFRVLNLHYNRNNQIEIPHTFCYVIQATLREFFKAIQESKDQDPSWKKAIYKIIARMDDSIPEYFKSVKWMETLESHV